MHNLIKAYRILSLYSNHNIECEIDTRNCDVGVLFIKTKINAAIVSADDKAILKKFGFIIANDNFFECYIADK